jgi:hypothetical protein
VYLTAWVDKKYLDGSYRCKNVTGAHCHSRRFVGWTDSVGRIVAWSVCRWTDRLGTRKICNETTNMVQSSSFSLSDSPTQMF